MNCEKSRKREIITFLRMRLVSRMTLEQAFTETRGYERKTLPELRDLLTMARREEAKP